MPSPKITVAILQDFLDAFNAHDIDAVGPQKVRGGIASRLGGIPDVRHGEDRPGVRSVQRSALESSSENRVALRSA